MGLGRARCLLAFALGTLVAYAASAPAGARAQTPVFGPGREAEVAALVFAGDAPPVLSDGVRVVGASIETAWIDVPLEGDGHRGRVRLYPRGEVGEGAPSGESASFSLRLVEGEDDPAIRRAAEALTARLSARDRGGFFSARGDAPDGGTGPTRRAPAGLARWLPGARRVAWVGLGLGLVALAALARRDGAWPRRRDAVVGAGLFTLAFALRGALPPWAPLHENDHGITELGGLLGRLDAHEARLYGGGYLHFVRWTSTILGRAPEAPFLAAALAGALVAPSLFVLARALCPGRFVGPLTVGLALAIHPAHLRLSTSESQRGLAGLLFVLGAALAALAFRATWSRAAREGAFVLTAVAWALALELHVQTMLLPIAGSALVLVAASSRARMPHPLVAALGVALVGGFAWAHLEELGPVLPDGRDPAFAPGLAVRGWLGPRNAIGDPTFAPALLGPLAALGALGLARARRTLAGVAAALALLGPASLLVGACRADAIRYQLDWQLALTLLLAGLPDVADLEALGSARARAVAWLPPLALVASALPGLVDVARPDAHAQAYAIARADAPPPDTAIVRLPARMADDPRVMTRFPDYAVSTSSRVVDAPPPRGTPCRVWIGVGCWSFTEEERVRGALGVTLAPSAPMRRECVEALGGPDAARAALDDLRAIDVPHRDEELHRVLAERPRIGYARCPDRP